MVRADNMTATCEPERWLYGIFRGGCWQAFEADATVKDGVVSVFAWRSCRRRLSRGGHWSRKSMHIDFSVSIVRDVERVMEEEGLFMVLARIVIRINNTPVSLQR